VATTSASDNPRALASHDHPDGPARILVVCTANIARSPLAAAMLAAEVQRRHLGACIRVDSAGVRARPGHPAAEHTLTVAARRGLDLRAHRSRPTIDAAPEGADLVLTMSQRQRDHLGGSYAGMAARVFSLPELARLLAPVDPAPLPPPGGVRLRAATRAAHLQRPRSTPGPEEDVTDPYGQPERAYEDLAARLDGLLAAVAPALLGPVSGVPPR